MLRVAVGSGMAAIGYLLVYCAVTAGGTYAPRPWDALSPSAPWPVGSSSSAASSSSSSSGGGIGGTLTTLGKGLLTIVGLGG